MQGLNPAYPFFCLEASAQNRCNTRIGQSYPAPQGQRGGD